MTPLFSRFHTCFSMILLCLGSFKALSATQVSTPALNESSFQSSPVTWAREIKSQISKSLSFNSCSTSAEQIAEQLKAFDPSLLDKAWIQNEGFHAINEIVQVRFSLNENLAQIPQDCRLQISAVLYSLRDIEDYLGETFFKVQPLFGDQLKFAEQSIPLIQKEKYNPYFLTPKVRHFRLEPGDIMITRGISFVSASIAQSTVLPSKYSHGVFVYVAPDGTPQTLESYISSGARFFSIEEALKNENARIMVFRSKDRTLAQKANDQMAKKIREALALHGRISYDYQSDYTEHEKLTCIEIPYAAYEIASEGKVILPQVRSEMMLTKPDLTKGLNVKPGPLFSPFNLEIDDRFEMVLEWTDYRLTQDQRNKDLVVRKIFELTEKENYIIQENMNSVFARLIWATRGVPLIWNMVNGIGDLKDLPADMPVSQIVTSAKLNKAAGIILNDLRRWQARQPGHVFTNQEIQEWIENYVVSDRDKYLMRLRADFHIYFRPLP